ncbi:MAG: rhamnan synthesis F family protein [Defluviitaleaceae bacterium]|nr:rhamnan synthesis F family protein [Defluviitaleaceae bacterium]
MDDYVPYYLNELVQNASHLVIVCNGFLSDEGRQKMSAFTEDLFVRPNIGFDAGAVKDVLFNFIGWDKLNEFDELLIANDTVLGPFRPLKEIFSKMHDKPVDFWGISWCARFYDDIDKGYVQSYFINIKERLLHSPVFKSFWHYLHPNAMSYGEIVSAYEMSFTQNFVSQGFMCAVYTDGMINDQNIIFSSPYDAIKRYNFPFIKRKSLICHTDAGFGLYTHMPANAIIDYIKNNTLYDEGLIWQHLLRTHTAYELSEYLKIKFALPDDCCKPGTVNKRLGVVANETAGNYIKKLNLEIISHDSVKLYDYICILNDKLPFDNEIMWENALSTPEYINNIVTVFEANPYLGFLTVPNHYYSIYLHDFLTNSPTYNAAWIRVAAIGEYIYIHDINELVEKAREQGFYSGELMTAKYAAMQSSDLKYMAVLFYNLMLFVRGLNKIYLYGTGASASIWSGIMDRLGIPFEGYIVSDHLLDRRLFLGKPVYCLHEIAGTGCGIVLSVMRQNARDVLPMINKKGFKVFSPFNDGGKSER